MTGHGIDMVIAKEILYHRDPFIFSTSNQSYSHSYGF